MCQLLETIKCKNGKLYNLEFHQKRFDFARKNIFGITDIIDLNDVLKVPEENSNGLFRCRVTYSGVINKVEFLPHRIRRINSLKLIEGNEIDYRYKYSNRDALNSLFEKKGDCDDILIVKNGCISDSWTANPVFYDGEKWWTPDTPLLAGIQRTKLIKEHKIFECRITKKDISKYKKVGLINALQNFEDMPVIEIKNIRW
jgi:4-amino-4-deoxychorismate lyase